MKQAVGKNVDSDISHFDTLGLRVQLESACRRTKAHIDHHLYIHRRPPEERSPDFIVRLREPLEKDRFRYLFRCQPPGRCQDLGVDIRNWGGRWAKWRHPDPVLLPYCLPQLRDRYSALHGGCVFNPDTGRATLLLGERESGKTTVSLHLCQRSGWRLLSDETSAIENWSKMAWPLLRAPLVRCGKHNGRLTKKPMSVNEMRTTIKTGPLSPIGRIVELVHIKGLAEPKVTPIDDPLIALYCLFRHNRAFGSTTATTTRTLADIARYGSAYRTMVPVELVYEPARLAQYPSLRHRYFRRKCAGQQATVSKNATTGRTQIGIDEEAHDAEFPR
ncbi:MAG: hypothetical protein V6Z86_01740 [Hyphomicrobiales bacterium]